MRKIVFDFSNIDRSDPISENQNNDKRLKKSTESIYECINDTMKSQKGKMGLGIQAVRKEKVKDKSIDETLERICNSGLDIRKGSSILATISSLGVSSELKEHQKEALKNYRLGNEVAENGVIILVPTILEGNDRKLYVGFPGMDTGAIGNNHKTTCILDKICCGNNEYGVFPKEFILGYFKEENGIKTFQKNASHFLEMSDEDKEAFIKELTDRLPEQLKQVSEAVIEGNMQKLEQLSMSMYGNKEGFQGENTLIQNAILYLNREKGQIEQNQSEEKSDKTRTKRKILLDSYQNIKISDLSDAKGLLREGIEQPEKSYEGNEK